MVISKLSLNASIPTENLSFSLKNREKNGVVTRSKIFGGIEKDVKPNNNNKFCSTIFKQGFRNYTVSAVGYQEWPSEVLGIGIWGNVSDFSAIHQKLSTLKSGQLEIQEELTTIKSGL